MITRLISSLSAIVVLGACGSGLNQPATEPMAAQVLYRGSRCPATQPGIQVLSDAASWAEWQRQQRQPVFSASEEPDAAAADLDFGQVSVIVISMGQKPTPGYAVELPEGSVTLQGTTLTISTIWTQPPEGAILAQVLTSPCIAIAVATTQYDTVKINDQHGDTVVDQRT